MASKAAGREDRVQLDPEWWKQYEAAKRIDHLLRWAVHLERFLNAPLKPNLERWPHVYLTALHADHGDPRKVPLKWDELEKRAKKTLALGGRDAAKLACTIQRRLRWIVGGLLAHDPTRKGGGHAVPRRVARAWAWQAVSYIVAVHQNLGWAGARGPHSRNRRSWSGVIEGNRPPDTASGRACMDPKTGKRLAFRLPQSWPRFCRICGAFFHARRKRARYCPDCRK